MAADWTLREALASVEPEVWAATPFSVVGLMLPAGNRVTVQFHHRIAASAITLPCDERQPGAALEAFRTLWNLGPLARVPIEEGGEAELFGALAVATPPGAADVEALQTLAQRIGVLSRGGEPALAREQRLERIHALSGVLAVLASALDLRTVFDQLSATARRVLPHDASVVGLYESGRRQVRMYALSVPEAMAVPEVIDNPYPQPLHEGWEFSVTRDLAAHPVDRHLGGARSGLRSSVRVPVRLDGAVAGVIDFSSLQPNYYTYADVPVLRRIADYVALALSHQKLAHDAHQAAAVRERAVSHEMLEALLATVTGVLDIRQVFDRVSTISDKVIAHDAMSIAIPRADRPGWTLHVATGALGHLATPFEMGAPTPALLDEHWDFQLVADMSDQPQFAGTPSRDAGMRAMLSIPVWFDGRLRASVNFFSRTAGQFTGEDVLVGRRIADHISLVLSHQRLVEEEARQVELRARAANLELLDELLARLSHMSELDEVVDRLSVIASKVLPHDAFVVPLMLPDGRHARVYARGGVDADQLPDVLQIPDTIRERHDWEFDIVDDLRAHPVQRDLEAAQRGYRSALRVPIRLDGRVAGALAFFAIRTAAFKSADAVVARRIADRLAQLLQRERGVEAGKRAEEASARAAALEARVRALTEELDARTGYRRVIGESAAWRQVLTQATQVAATDTTALLLGESGTGKEVIARFLHRASPRHDGPFVALNCAALPEHLLEAELFGYERGAFTGATQSKPGQLEQAAGGTLFLDEVGEMSAPAQAKFLRVLQEREFQRLGGTRIIRADARVVAATNRDLQRAMANGTFREDLFYRLNVFAIRLPALRDRRDDVLPLGEAFLAEYSRSLGRPPSGLSREARDRLLDYHWPGNVRELRNILERAAILCEGGLITCDHLSLTVTASRAASAQPANVGRTAASASPPPASPAAPDRPAAAGDLKEVERAMIAQALERARFNKSEAAKALGLTRAQLYVRMKRYGLE